MVAALLAGEDGLNLRLLLLLEPTLARADCERGTGGVATRRGGGGAGAGIGEA